MLDSEVDNMVQATQLRDRSKSRQWLAEKWNREQYGSTKTTQIAISVGGLHLDALRARPITAAVQIVDRSNEPARQVGAGETTENAGTLSDTLAEVPALAASVTDRAEVYRSPTDTVDAEVID